MILVINPYFPHFLEYAEINDEGFATKSDTQRIKLDDSKVAAGGGQ